MTALTRVALPRQRASRPSWLRYSAAWVALALGCQPVRESRGDVAPPVAQAEPVESIEWSDELFPTYVLVEDAKGQQWFVTRVVDDATGLPIAGASVHAVRENEHPVGGQFHAERTVTTDRDGFARMPLDDAVRSSYWFFAAAPGYATYAEMGVREWYRLSRGVDVPVILRDYADRPVAGADVAWVESCGHGPDILHATTDARGRATLPQLDLSEITDIYPVAPGLVGEYESQRWTPGHGPMVLRWQPGTTVRGTLVDERGAPLRELMVGIRTSVHRGAWCRTAADGSFALRGVELGYELIEVWTPDHHELGKFGHPFLQEPANLTLRATRTEGPAVDRSLTVRVSVPDKSATKGIAVRVLWLVDGDWRSNEAETGSDGVATLRVPGVPLRLECRHPDADIERAHRELSAVTPAGADVAVALSALPRVAVRVKPLSWWMEGRAQQMASRSLAAVAADGRRWTATIGADGTGSVAVPRQGEFALVADERRRWPRTSVFADVAACTDPVVVTLCDPPRVTGRLVDVAGQPIAGTVGDDADHAVVIGSDGRFTFEDRDSDQGGIDLEFTPAENADARPLVVRVAYPADPTDGPIDLGDVRLDRRDAPLLRILGADGEPATGARLLDGSGHSWGDPDLAEDGGWEGRRPRAGDVVVATWGDAAADFVAMPLRCELHGDGPWLLRAPAGQVEIACVDERGEPTAATLDFPGLERPVAVAGALHLRGVAGGWHRAFAYAEGRRTCIAQFHLRDGERRTLRLVLPERR